MVFVRLIGLILLTGLLGAIGSVAMPFAYVFFVAVVAVYMFPTVEGWINKQPNLIAIALVNIFLGWTLIGWVLALVWGVRKPEAVIAHQAPPAVDPMPAAATGDQPSPAVPKAAKTCPFCAEEILAAAIKCKHCGSDLPAGA